MGCSKFVDGKCQLGAICSGDDASRDCFMELEHDQAPDKTDAEKLIDKIDQSLEKIDNALIGATAIKAEFLQLKKDFDVLRNRCNNVLMAGSAINAHEHLITLLADKLGYHVVKSEEGVALKKKAAKRAVKKVAKKASKKAVKKTVKKAPRR